MAFLIRLSALLMSNMIVHCMLTCANKTNAMIPLKAVIVKPKPRFDVNATLSPQQMLLHKGGQIKTWGGECRDVKLAV